MQSLRRTILNYMTVRVSVRARFVAEDMSRVCLNLRLLRKFSITTSSNHDEVLDRVLKLVKNFNKVDPAKVTEKANFQKDLSLDSLDRVELVMALEEEFSVEIPEAEADKLKCCVDVASYIVSQPTENSTSS